MNVNDELQNIKDELQQIYSRLEIIRDNIPSDIQAGINKARSIVPVLENSISYQQDLVVFRNRDDISSIARTLNKIEKL